MAVGKYVTNIGVITTAFGVFGVAKQAKRMPPDWRRYIVWGVWAASLTLAVASVKYADDDNERVRKNQLDNKARKQEDKALKKARKQAKKQY